MAWSAGTTFLLTLTLATLCSAKFGFIASRGKRSLENEPAPANNNNLPASSNTIDDSIIKQIEYLELLRNRPSLSMYKRLPSDYESYKRAPSGFVGMRGKKANEYWPDYTYPDSDAWTSAKQDIFDFNPNSYHDNDVDFHDIYEKRAPSGGFMGMRGRREGDKRVPTGFFGVRGKRDGDKRVPTGFMGMRGKKDVDEEMLDEKRAPLVNYFGIRGKKMPLHSGFFGMRGKKQPFEFRRKFVGVRGKKNPDGSLRQLEQQLNDFANYDIDKLDSTGSSSDTIKRAPSGFMGVRGKKDEEEVSAMD